MCDASTTAGAIRVKRWAIIALLTIALTLLAGGLFMAAWWGLGRIPRLVLLAGGTGLPPGRRVHLRHGRGADRPRPPGAERSAHPRSGSAPTRAVGNGRRPRAPLCAAPSIGLVADEVVSAIWQARAHRQTAVPIGGLRRGAETEDSAGPPIAAADVGARPRDSPSRVTIAASTWWSWASRAPRGSRTTVGCRSGRSSRGSSVSCFRAPRPVAALGPDGRHPRGPASEARRAGESARTY